MAAAKRTKDVRGGRGVGIYVRIGRSGGEPVGGETMISYAHIKEKQHNVSVKCRQVNLCPRVLLPLLLLCCPWAQFLVLFRPRFGGFARQKPNTPRTGSPVRGPQHRNRQQNSNSNRPRTRSKIPRRGQESEEVQPGRTESLAWERRGVSARDGERTAAVSKKGGPEGRTQRGTEEEKTHDKTYNLAHFGCLCSSSKRCLVRREIENDVAGGLCSSGREEEGEEKKGQRETGLTICLWRK